MLIERAEIAGRAPHSLLIAGERIAEIGPALEPRRGEERLTTLRAARCFPVSTTTPAPAGPRGGGGSVRCGPPWCARATISSGPARARPLDGWTAASDTTTRLRARWATATSTRSHRASRSASSTAAARSGS